MREIRIKSGDRQELAVIEDGRLCEYILDDTTGAAAEAIYVGRVVRVMTGMKAAFVDIGQEKNGFLPLVERSQTCRAGRLQDGMTVLVQIKKQAQGTKGAFLTRDITLGGEYVIYMPMNHYIGVSSRVESDDDKEALRQLGKKLSVGAFGLVMRNAANDADEAVIAEELEQLKSAWETVAKAAPTAHVPSMLYRPRTQLDILLADYAPRGIDRIVTDDTALTLPYPMEHRGDPMADVLHQRDKALERYVWLNCGGNLVIDRCEAMTVIDVNTAKNTGKRDLEMTIMKTNLEACAEIARQVRLRNLSGMILIDMIDMTTDEHRQAVLDALTEAFRADRIKTVIHGFTSLGLVEMTRKKSRQPLSDDWTTPCKACHGTGRVRINEEEHHG